MTLEYQAAASFPDRAVNGPWVYRSCDQHVHIPVARQYDSSQTHCVGPWVYRSRDQRVHILVARQYDSSQIHYVGQHGTVEAVGITM